MNTIAQPSPFQVNRASAGAILALLLAASSAAPALRADVRVGVSLGVELPHGYAEVVVGREHYYEHRGVFYQHGPHGYVVVRAPRGALVRVLPPHCMRIYVGRDVFYRYGDVYYQEAPGGFLIVDPPAVQVLPPVQPAEEYRPVMVNKQEYLFKGGQFFMRTPEGVVWCRAPLGAVVAELPANVQRVWYQNQEYFENDEVYYRQIPIGYQVVEAPWKK